MALINLGLGQKNVQIICTFFLSVAISGINLCFTGVNNYHKPSALFFGVYVLSVVNLTKVSPCRFTFLLESSATNKKLACDKEFGLRTVLKKINERIFIIKVNCLKTLWLHCCHHGSIFLFRTYFLPVIAQCLTSPFWAIRIKRVECLQSIATAIWRCVLLASFCIFSW